MVNMISTEHQWRPQEQESKHMKDQTDGGLGTQMDKTGGILDQY
jgi:hypothetical protein